MLSASHRPTTLIAGFGLGAAALNIKYGNFDGLSFSVALVGFAAMVDNMLVTRSPRAFSTPQALGQGPGVWIAHSIAIFAGTVLGLTQLAATVHEAADNVAVTVLTILAVTAGTVAQLVTIARGWGSYRRYQTYASEAAQRAARRRP